MTRLLFVDYSKCTGCRLCEVVCSANKLGSVNPARSRITVVKQERICLDVPMLCQQCESAPCIAVCPVKALTRDEQLGRVGIDYGLCIGCRFCIAVCPFGAMRFDGVDRKVFKCDLCDGDPTCVRFCEPKALQYIDASTANIGRLRQAAMSLIESIDKWVAHRASE